MDPRMPRRSVDQLLANVEGMRRLARRLVGDAAAADDVTQDALVVAMTRRPRHGGNLKGWLNGIVRNVARERRRKEARRVRREEAAPAKPPSRPTADLAAQAAEQKRLIDAVTSLAEPYRRAVWRRYFENMPPRAIAREDGVPVETVRTWIKRAHAQLRAKLDETHGGDRRAWVLALSPMAIGGSEVGLPALIGGTLVAAKSKPVLLTALVLLVGGALFWMLRDRSRDTSHLADTGLLATEEAGAAGAGLQGRGARQEAATVAPVPSDPALRITGRVLDERGEPLQGAEIRVGALATTRIDALTLTARSGSDGSFALARPEEGAVRVAAVAPGRLTAFEVVQPTARDPITLRLPRVPTFTFRVLDGTTDEPLEGVRCETRRLTHGRTWTVQRRTDAQGLVAMPSPVPHALDFHFAMRLEHPGYRPITSIRRGSLGQTTGTSEQPREVYLFPSTDLVFVVHDERGRPVPGARVRAWTGGQHISHGPEWAVRHVGAGPVSDDLVFLGEVLSDERGRARLGEGPKNAVWHVRAETEEGIGFVWGSRPPRHKEGPVVITLQRAVHVRGRVTDSEGRPVANAVVQAMPWRYARALQKGGRVRLPSAVVQEGLYTRTDADGRYDLKGVGVPAPPDKAHIQTHRGDLGFAHAPLDASASRSDLSSFDLQFERKDNWQSVRVVDEQGDPVAGAIAMWENVVPGSITDEDGRTRLLVYPGQRRNVTASHAGYVASRVPAAESGEEIEVALTKAVTFSGRLVDPEGAGHAGYVDFYAPKVATMAKEQQTQIFGPHWHGRAIADAQGYFHVSGLPPGPWYVGFWYTTRKNGNHHTVRGDGVIAGTEPVVLELPEVEPTAQPGAVVTGTVVDAEGKPVTEYWLYLKQPKRTHAPILLGRRFRIEDVPPGTYTLSASAASLKTEVPVVVREAGEALDVRVVLSATVEIAGRLLDNSGTPVSKQYVMLFPEGKEHWVALANTKDDGTFTMEGLVPGRYRARLRVFRGAPSPIHIADDLVVLEGGRKQEITLRTAPAGSLFTTFDDERFLPYTEDRYEKSATEAWRHSMGATVYVVGKHGRRWKGEGLWRGRTAFPYPLPPGAYELVVTTKDEQSFRSTFSIRAGAESEVAVAVSR